MKLKDIGLTVEDLDIGAANAESDRRLGEYFVTTPQARAALEYRKMHFLGRKGSGKSSLFRQLPSLLVAEKRNVLIAQLTPDQYAWAALKKYRELGLMPEQAHANAWKFTLALQAAGALIESNDSALSEAARKAMGVLRRFVHQNFDNQVNPLSTASKLLAGLGSFNLEAFGFGIGVERARVEQTLTPQVIQAIFDQLSIISREVGVLISLDQLDDSWDGSDDAQSLLIGLLKAAKETNDRYSQRDGTGITVLVFLRSDIYEGLRFDDKDKHRQFEEELSWNPELLKQMLQRRLPKGVSVDELFEEGDMRGSIALFNYLVKRTFLRPREVIQFVHECQRQSAAGVQEISKDALRAAEERYSVWKVEDLKQEYSRRYPDFERALEALRQGYHRFDSLEEFEQHLTERIPEFVEKHGARPIMELLFNASVIGVRLGDSGTARFRCEDNDLLLPAAGGVYVHQSLYKGLSIRERRAGDRAEDTDEPADSDQPEWLH